MAELSSIFEINDCVLIVDGELAGCTGVVRDVGSGGLLVVKPDEPREHPPVVIPDSAVQLRDLRKAGP